MQKTKMKRSARGMFALACMGLGALSGAVMVSTASANRADQSVIGAQMVLPYDGFLMFDGEGVSGQRYIRFELYDAATGGTKLWEEEQSVQVYNGRFSAGLGSSVDLTTTVLDAEQLFIGMTVVNRNSGGAVTSEASLSGRQEIKAAPFAAWSKDSANKNVADSLDVDGTFTDQGTLTATQKVTIDGDANLTGTLSATGTLDVNDFYTSGAATAPSWGTSGVTTVNGTFSTTGNDSLGNGSGDTTTVTTSTLDIPQGISFGTSGSYTLEGPRNIYGYNDLRIRRSSSSANDLVLNSSGVTFGGDLAVDANEEVDLKNLTTTGAATFSSSVTVSGDADIVGQLPTTSRCYGSPIADMSRNDRRLCAYSFAQTDITWWEASDKCWDDYGAELCSASQMAALRISGQVSSSETVARYWLRDRIENNTTVYLKDTSNTGYFDEGANANTAELDGAYCCMMVEY